MWSKQSWGSLKNNWSVFSWIIWIYLIGIVGLNNQSVYMSIDIIFAADILIDQNIFTLVAEDYVNL